MCISQFQYQDTTQRQKTFSNVKCFRGVWMVNERVIWLPWRYCGSSFKPRQEKNKIHLRYKNRTNKKKYGQKIQTWQTFQINQCRENTRSAFNVHPLVLHGVFLDIFFLWLAMSYSIFLLQTDHLLLSTLMFFTLFLVYIFE